MSTLHWILTAAGVVLAAVLGIKFGHERELARALKRAKVAEDEAAKARHEARRAALAAEVKRIELDLKEERQRPLADRVAESVRKARELRERSGRSEG